MKQQQQQQQQQPATTAARSKALPSEPAKKAAPAIRSLATDFIMTMDDDADDDVEIKKGLARKFEEDDDDDENDEEEDDGDENGDGNKRKLPVLTKAALHQNKRPRKQDKKALAKEEDKDINPELEFEIDTESGKATNTWELTTAKKAIAADAPQLHLKSKTLDELIEEKRLSRKKGKKGKKEKAGKNDESDENGAVAAMDIDGDDDFVEEEIETDGEDGVMGPEDEGDDGAEEGAADDDDDDDDDDDNNNDSSSDDSSDDDNDQDSSSMMDMSDDEKGSSEERARKDKLKSDFFGEVATSVVASRQFTEMNLSRPLLRAVAALNFASATEIQAATIPVALMGRDIVACAKTGSGKTAAFLLPILERLLYRPRRVPVSRVLVLSPTRELAVQCHAMAEKLAKYTDVKLCLVVGGFSEKKQETELRLHPDIIVATPGRLIDHIHNTLSFDLEGIEILVMDEADRLLEMGFKEAIDEIIQRCPTARQSMLFSATMTDEVEDLITLSMNKPIRLFVDKNTDTSVNLTQEFVRVRPQRMKDKEAMVLALCKRSFHSKTIVFFRSKQSAHRFKILFGLFGLKAAELHGDLQQLQRLESLESFRDGTVDFLLATDLASRGLDIVGVETVINADMPNTLTQYIHRVGRTARAGRLGRSVSLVCEGERKLLKEIVKSSVVPLKSRVIPIEVIEKYSARIKSLEDDFKEVLSQEKEEKMLRQAEMEANKAQNMLTHEKEIFSRPAKTWFQDAVAKKESKEKSKQSYTGVPSAQAAALKASRGQKRKHEDDEDEKAGHIQKHAARIAKSQRKGLRVGDAPIRATPAGGKTEGKKSKGKSLASSVGFEKELTDTSKSALRGLRNATKGDAGSKKDAKKEKDKSKNFKTPAKKALKTKKQFKSSNRYKRR